MAVRVGESMSGHVLIDGLPADGNCLEERAFQFGDGLFETLAVVDGQPCLWDGHIRRLLVGCERLNLPTPDVEQLHAECLRLCERSRSAALKIFWTAGRTERGYRRADELKPQRIVKVMDWQPRSPAPWRLQTCGHRLSENPSLARIKHLNRLDQVLARAELRQGEREEGIVLDQKDLVVSGSMSNLFIQQGNRLLTPPIVGAGIAGVVRELALQLAVETGSFLDEEALTLQQVGCADALYMTNSLIGVVRVESLDETSYDLSVPQNPLMTQVSAACRLPSLKGSLDNG